MKRVSYKMNLPLMLLLGASYAYGNTIKEVVEQTMVNNPQVMSIMKNNQAYRLYIDEAKGGYYPKLDLTTYVGTKRTKTDPDSNTLADTEEDTQGFNAQLDFEQLIYDGGLTSGEVEEAEARYKSNKHLNDSIIDDIIFQSVDSYLNLVKFKNKVAVTNNTLKVYDDYLVAAKETEKISGEALQKSQVSVKMHFAKNALYTDENSYMQAASAFKKNVGIEPDGKSCRPLVDNSNVPASLKELIDMVLVKNPLILEQVENIKEQRGILNQRDANFYPTLKFKAQAIYDDDLQTKNEDTEIYSARIELAYNLFNGGKDKASTQRERLFLEESQKKLDDVTNQVVEEVTNAYNTYMTSVKRVAELEQYIDENEKVLSFYKDQFEGGTRTFIDVLNVERDLNAAKQILVDVEYDYDSAYYQIFNSLGNIKEAILDTNNPECTNSKALMEPKKMEEPAMQKDDEELKSMLTDDDTMMKPGTYAVYFVAYKDEARTNDAISSMKEMLGDSYSIKSEPARGFYSAVVYNVETIEEANSVKTKIVEKYSDAYIRKIK